MDCKTSFALLSILVSSQKPRARSSQELGMVPMPQIAIISFIIATGFLRAGGFIRPTLKSHFMTYRRSQTPCSQRRMKQAPLPWDEDRVGTEDGYGRYWSRGDRCER